MTSLESRISEIAAQTANVDWAVTPMPTGPPPLDVMEAARWQAQNEMYEIRRQERLRNRAEFKARYDDYLEKARRQSHAWYVAEQAAPFVGTATDINRGLFVAKGAEKLQRDERLTDGEIKALAETKALQEWSERNGMLGQALDMAAMIPSFVGELALTGGAASVAEAGATGLFKAGVRKGLERTIGKIATRGVEKAAVFASGIAALTASNPQLVAKAAVEQATPLLNLSAIERDDFQDIILRPGYDHWLRNALLGTYSELAIQFGGDLVQSQLAAVKGGLLTNWMGATKPPRTLGMADKLLKRAGYQGVFAQVVKNRAMELSSFVLPGQEGRGGVLTELWNGEAKRAMTQVGAELIALSSLPLIRLPGRLRQQKGINEAARRFAELGLLNQEQAKNVETVLSAKRYVEQLGHEVAQEDFPDSLLSQVTTREAKAGKPVKPGPTTVEAPQPTLTSDILASSEPVDVPVDGSVATVPPVPAFQVEARSPGPTSRISARGPKGRAVDTTERIFQQRSQPEQEAVEIERSVPNPEEPTVVINSPDAQKQWDQLPRGAKGSRRYIHIPEGLSVDTGDVPEDLPWPGSSRVLTPMPPPLLVRMANELKIPLHVDEKLRSAGLFVADPASGRYGITVHPGAAQNAHALALTLAHELGHFDNLARAGALKGVKGDPMTLAKRMTGLKSGIFGWMSSTPETRGAVTSLPHYADIVEGYRARAGRYEGRWRRVHEAITPEDLVKLRKAFSELGTEFDRLGKARLRKGWSRDLVKYLNGLDDFSLMDLFTGGTRGFVRGDMEAFHKLVDRYVRTFKRPPKTQEEWAIDTALRVYAEQHKLINENVIRRELIDLTDWMSPVDYGRLTPKQRAYRASDTELYANAAGMMLVDPATVEARAPQFFRGWLGWLDANPSLRSEYIRSMAQLHETPEELTTQYLRMMEEDQVRGVEAYRRFYRLTQTNWYDYPEAVRVWTVAKLFDKSQPAKAKAKQMLKLEQAEQEKRYIAAGYSKREAHSLARSYQGSDSVRELSYKLERFTRSTNPFQLTLYDSNEKVLKPLEDAGISMKDVDSYLQATGITSFRKGKINPYGLTKKEGLAILDRLKQTMGEEKYARMRELMDVWHNEIVFPVFEALHDAGGMGETTWEAVQRNKDVYSTFYHIDKMLETQGQQVGTVEPIKGSFTGVGPNYLNTMLKLEKVHRLTEVQNATNAVLSLLKASGEDLVRREVPHGQHILDPKTNRPPHGPKYAWVYRLEGGRLVAYEVKKPYAYIFANSSEELGHAAPFFKFLNSFTYGVMHPLLIRYNPGFALINPIRDTFRTWKHLGAAISKERYDRAMAILAEKPGSEKSPKARRRAWKEAKAQAKEEMPRLTMARILAATKASWEPASENVEHGVIGQEMRQLLEDRVFDFAFAGKYIENPEEAMHGENPQAAMHKEMLRMHGVTPENGRDMLNRFLKQIGEYEERMFHGLDLATRKSLESKVEKTVKAGYWALEPFRFIDRFNNKWERASKMAAMKILEDYGVTGAKRASMVRWYAGTPEYRVKGSWALVPNSLSMYWKVRVNAMRASLALATDKGSAPDFFMRTAVQTLAMSTLTHLIRRGVVPVIGEKDGYLHKLLNAIPDVYYDYFDVVPLGFQVPVGGGEAKPIFLTVPLADDDILLNRVWRGLIDETIDLVRDSNEIDEGEAAQAIMQDLIGGYLNFGKGNPLMLSAIAWMNWGQGVPTYDPFRGSFIIPDRISEQGPYAGFGDMVAWQLKQTGAGSMFADWGRIPFGPQTLDKSWGELILKGVPGINRMIRISNSGIKGHYYDLMHDETQQERQFSDSFPARVTSLRRLYGVMNKMPDKELTHSDRRKLMLLKSWNKLYHAYRQGIKDAETAGQQFAARHPDQQDRFQEVEAAGAQRAEHLREKLDQYTEAYEKKLRKIPQ